MGQSKPPTNAPYWNTYNPNWRNHLNLSWKPKPPAYAPTGSQQQQHHGYNSQQQQPPPLSPVEQAIVNLSKVVGNFMEEHKAVNAQTSQKIETLEGTLNKKIDDLHYSVSRLTNQQQVLEEGKFPSQTQPNPRGVHELSSASDPNPRIDEVKAVVTLRSGREIKPSAPKPAVEDPNVVEPEPEDEAPKGDTVNKSIPPPFPQALRNKKNAINQIEILEVLR